MFDSSTRDQQGEDTIGTLHVVMKEAKNLPKLSRTGHANSYAELYLLPDKGIVGLRKTGVIKNELNPVWEEEFAYDKVTLGELRKARVLEVPVLNHGAIHKVNVFGCVHLGPCIALALWTTKKWMDFKCEPLGGVSGNTWQVGGILVCSEIR